MRIRMLTNVWPDMGFLGGDKPDTVLRAGTEYEATSNPYGAISGICENGKRLGVKPGEFEFVEAPDWVLKIWKEAGYHGDSYPGQTDHQEEQSGDHCQ